MHWFKLEKSTPQVDINVIPLLSFFVGSFESLEIELCLTMRMSLPLRFSLTLAS